MKQVLCVARQQEQTCIKMVGNMNVSMNTPSHPISNIAPIGKPVQADPLRRKPQAGVPQVETPVGPAYHLSISAEAYRRYESLSNSGTAFGGIDIEVMTGGIFGVSADNAVAEMTACVTCSSRLYVDVSDDPSVSFQTPQRINQSMAAITVIAHEHEHMRNEQANASKDGGMVISQRATIHTSICTECNRMYISGGSSESLIASAHSRYDGEDGNLASTSSYSGVTVKTAKMMSIPESIRFFRMNSMFSLYQNVMKAQPSTASPARTKNSEAIGFLNRTALRF